MTLEAFKEAVKKDGWVIVRGNGYIYFKRRDPSRAYNQGDVISCGTKDPETAMEKIRGWLIHGFPAREKDDPETVGFLYSFWNEESKYFKSAVYEGRHFTRAYINQNRQFIRVYVQPFFKSSKLSELSEKKLDDFITWLFSYRKKLGGPLSGQTITRIKSGVFVALKWGRQEGIIRQPIDFSIVHPKIGRFGRVNRGILTQAETARLLSYEWPNKKIYVAFCIAVYCGLRIGEIRALRIGDIRNGFIVVSRSCNDTDGIKCPKNGKSRIVPCADSLLRILNEYINEIPEAERKEENLLLTYGDNIPLERGSCLRGFYTAMKHCGIERERENPLTGEREKICFHSLRHQTATRWVESGIDLRLIASAMGHTVQILQHYSDHVKNADMESLRAELMEADKLDAVKLIE